MTGDEHALIGQPVGGYRLERLIGQGGMGAVYLGVHPTLDKRVAVKVMLRGLAESEDSQRRFLEEARLAASLDHPAIVEVIDLAELPDHRLYMVMEFLEGESLERHLRRRGALPVGEAIAIAAEALSGLAVAHARGVVHRDIKPANLFLEIGPRLKILDFGLAKLFAGAQPGKTASGAIVGTPGYMAPEQTTTGKAVDARVDLYAIGVVLYEMLAGAPPFSSDDWVELLHLHRAAAPPPIAGAPEAVQAVVRRALAKAPDDRFADATAMRDALVAASPPGALPVPEPTPLTDVEPSHATIATRPASPRAPAVPTRRTRPIVAVTAAAGVIAIGLFAWRATRRDRSDAVTPTVHDAADATPIVAVTPDAAIAADATTVIAAPAGDGGHVRVANAAPTPPPIPPPIPPIPLDAELPTAEPPRDAAIAAAAPTDALVDYFLVDGIPDIASFDVTHHLGDMGALARRIYRDARLVEIRGLGLVANGTFDLRLPASNVVYTYRSDAASIRHGPSGLHVYCLVTVEPHQGSIQVSTTWSDSCGEPYFAPRCTGAAMFAKARAGGAPADAALSVALHGTTWRIYFGNDSSYELPDAECK